MGNSTRYTHVAREKSDDSQSHILIHFPPHALSHVTLSLSHIPKRCNHSFLSSLQSHPLHPELISQNSLSLSTYQTGQEEPSRAASGRLASVPWPPPAPRLCRALAEPPPLHNRAAAAAPPWASRAAPRPRPRCQAAERHRPPCTVAHARPPVVAPPPGKFVASHVSWSCS